MIYCALTSSKMAMGRSGEGGISFIEDSTEIVFS